MKVFKMNDCDWVCAESEEQAKGFYHELTGVDMIDIEEYFEGEVSLSRTMYISLDDLPEEEMSMPQTTLERYGETWVLKTFEWVIKNDKITEPCIISSTEY
jgi:hypothetical protein